MYSLVVLLSVVALAAAKPSVGFAPEVISYSAPVFAAAPSAISSQSRIDIKSSPAIVSTAAVAPIARTVIAEPAVYAAPAIVAPAAVSHQSRLDIKSTPAITSTVVSAPVAYSAPIATAAIAPAFLKTYAEPAFLKTTYAAPALLKTEYAAPVLATSAIAAPTILKSAELVPAAIGAPAVPLETPEVAAARAAHFEAKALAEAHSIHKRSVLASHIVSPVVSTYAAAPLYSHSAHLISSPLTYSYSTPYISRAYGIRSW